ncbi:hypothetical protein DPMN_035418 [Dreissena polymorpha]|uniref:Uncharacterized protein n=1 Tax=Dreissena polymorpha TaxID=45954 RepID=A0A9D4RLX2_DREPO|nr:hypothetical protein DPMN_035418 [Dreissena polymorpha]
MYTSKLFESKERKPCPTERSGKDSRSSPVCTAEGRPVVSSRLSVVYAAETTAGGFGGRASCLYQVVSSGWSPPLGGLLPDSRCTITRCSCSRTPARDDQLLPGKLGNSREEKKIGRPPLP